jgi:hypothetical protein
VFLVWPVRAPPATRNRTSTPSQLIRLTRIWSAAEAFPIPAGFLASLCKKSRSRQRKIQSTEVTRQGGTLPDPTLSTRIRKTTMILRYFTLLYLTYFFAEGQLSKHGLWCIPSNTCASRC